MSRTFLDAGVLIAAIRGTPEIADRAMDLLNDPERLFVSSDFVQLEVLPKAVYFRQRAEASFYQAYFASVTEMVPVSHALVLQASEQAERLPGRDGCAACGRGKSWRGHRVRYGRAAREAVIPRGRADHAHASGPVRKVSRDHTSTPIRRRARFLLPASSTGTLHPSGVISRASARATSSSLARNTSSSDTPRRSSSPSGTVTSLSTPASIFSATSA